ncbi:MAG: T9SS type A sorting domain-containing protein [Melioribacteraceae bacterium]
MPTKPILASPGTNLINQPKDILLKWNRVRDVEKYFIQASKQSTFSSFVVDDSTTSDTVKAITNLDNNSQFYWRVRGKNVAGYGDWSDVWNFTTIVALPTKPVLATPSTNLINQPKDILLKWNRVRDAEKYFIQLSKDQTFVIIAKSDSTTTDTLKTITGLSEGQKYYWRVQAKNIAGASPRSDAWTFTTVLNKPDNLAITRSGLKETKLTWKDNSSEETGYIIDRRISSVPSYAVLDTVKENIVTYLDKKVEQGLTYFYRVKGYTKDAESGYSNEVSIVVVSVEEKEIPTEYSLSQNYPNPFNPTTKIKFGLPENAMIKLTIYDVLGREIDVLINSELEAGFHEINYNASKLTSGVYFYTIKASNFSDTKKFMLLK